MFFLQERNYKQRQTKTFSTAYRMKIEKSTISKIKNPLMYMITEPARRTVFAPPIILRASMTVEAAVLLPFFLLLMMSLYSVIDMLRLQGTVTWYLHQIGNEVCVYGCLTELLSEDEETIIDLVGDIGFSYLYVKSRIEEKVDFPGETFFTTISILEEGQVELVLTYNYPLPFAIGRTKEIWLQSKFFGLAWTKEGADKEEEDQIVYIAKTGQVYHLYQDCSHLQLSVQEVPRSFLSRAIQEYERTLVPCSVCTDEIGTKAYITIEQGKYHYSRDCLGLKRTVYTREMSWAQTQYEMCQRCKERKEKYNG